MIILKKGNNVIVTGAKNCSILDIVDQNSYGNLT